jgi:hypothetical protein
MSDKKSDFDREMTKLEAEIKRLEVEYNMFFAGRLPRLPWETRARVEQIVKRYDRMNLSNTAQRFRFGTVQAKFMSFCELWERNLRAKEEGRPTRGRTAGAPPSTPETASLPAPVDESASRTQGDEPVEVGAAATESKLLGPEPLRPSVKPAAAPTMAAAPPPAPLPARTPVPLPPARGSFDVTRIGDVGRDSDRVTALYDELTRARKTTGEAPMPFDRFATVVKAQIAKLGGSAGEVDFRVSVSQGKVTLMAKKADE